METLNGQVSSTYLIRDLPLETTVSASVRSNDPIVILGAIRIDARPPFDFSRIARCAAFRAIAVRRRVFRQVIPTASNFVQIVYRQLVLVSLLGLVSHFLFYRDLFCQDQFNTPRGVLSGRF